jgi:hypothetical protein
MLELEETTLASIRRVGSKAHRAEWNEPEPLLHAPGLRRIGDPDPRPRGAQMSHGLDTEHPEYVHRGRR